ncbi:MAG: hypothetical protein KIT84_42365 [Labilithrix sp.]|nr:hypothetical protein [Labilithrix sp.]MCW5817721.1 hypothetical protein [Labilithrix sp.]
MAEDLTTRILIEIRDEMRKTREELGSRIDKTNERLDKTNERLDRLEQRQHEGEIRLATEIVAVAAAVRQLTEHLRDDREVRAQVADHERRLAILETNRAPGE